MSLNLTFFILNLTWRHTNFGKNHTKFDVDSSQSPNLLCKKFYKVVCNFSQLFCVSLWYININMEHSKKQHIQVPNSVSSPNFKQDGRTARKEYNDLNVYAQIKKFMNGQTKMAIVSIARLAQDCEMSNQGVVNSIKRLEECGDIEKRKVGKCNAYKFNTNSEKFEMYDYEFLKNKGLTSQQKAFMIAVQKHLFVDKDTGIAKTTYDGKELAEKTGISESTIYRRVSELIDNNFISKRLTSDNDGNSTEALEFNLPKFGQFVLCKIEQHDIIIAQQQMELNKLKYEMELMKKYLKATSIDLASIDNDEIEL